MSGAEAHLQDLLPKLAAAAGVRSLSYVSIQNQGNYLLELPAARTDVPQGWDKVRPSIQSAEVCKSVSMASHITSSTCGRAAW